MYSKSNVQPTCLHRWSPLFFCWSERRLKCLHSAAYELYFCMGQTNKWNRCFLIITLLHSFCQALAYSHQLFPIMSENVMFNKNWNELNRFSVCVVICVCGSISFSVFNYVPLQYPPHSLTSMLRYTRSFIQRIFGGCCTEWMPHRVMYACERPAKGSCLLRFSPVLSCSSQPLIGSSALVYHISSACKATWSAEVAEKTILFIWY